MARHDITPIQAFGDWWAKREDAACYTSDDMPSGTKVRVFLDMVEASPPDTPLVVGCSGDSMMQGYLAAAGTLTGRTANVFVPRRKKRSAETEWAVRNGATIHEVFPGYPAVYRKAARVWAADNGGAVRWDRELSTNDTRDQVKDIPDGVERIVVPIGSGAICAGVVAGVARLGRPIRVLGVAVSDLATYDDVWFLACKSAGTDHPIGRFAMVRAEGGYATKRAASLPDGTTLDPQYAAKALPFVGPGDMLWVSGRRMGLRYVAPVAS